MLHPLEHETERLALSLGRQMVRSFKDAEDLHDAEFGVFSQWGEDGIIQFLLRRVAIESRFFVEFGVESYRESNTRFLLQNDLWAGLILDAGTRHIRFITESGLRWRHTIDARSVFITKDNIVDVLLDAGVGADFGLLSIDVDGNDYWILRALSAFQPRILIIEYNSLFGATAAITVPYHSGFWRNQAHPSGLYYGASLAALWHEATGRGYQLVGCDSAGVNAFFVRTDVAGDLPSLSPEQAFIPRQHREARGAKAQLTYISGRHEQLRLIENMPMVDVVTDDVYELSRHLAIHDPSPERLTVTGSARAGDDRDPGAVRDSSKADC